jgi:hypothetical protein
MSKWLLGRQQTNLDEIKIFLKVIGIDNMKWIECVQDRAIEHPKYNFKALPLQPTYVVHLI